MGIIFRKFAISYVKTQMPQGRICTDPVTRLGRMLWILVVLAMIGCSESNGPSLQEAVLIRTDQETITLAQFERAFEAARIAYSDERSVEPQVLENARLRLLNQMAEEVIIDRRAKELGIVLEESELDAAIQAIRSDYPDDTFEQMLLESAIPFSLWKERLRARMLMEKVVDRELVQPLTITTQEIEEYYKAHEKEFPVQEGEPLEADMNRQIVERLRREKVEAAYPQWMDGLRERYQVEINWELWEKSRHPGAQ